MEYSYVSSTSSLGTVSFKHSEDFRSLMKLSGNIRRPNTKAEVAMGIGTLVVFALNFEYSLLFMSHPYSYSIRPLRGTRIIFLSTINVLILNLESVVARSKLKKIGVAGPGTGAC